ncbi:MAG: hypothetical protein R3E66_13630 [bacterium]
MTIPVMWMAIEHSTSTSPATACKRGYRVRSTEAPLKENVAAACLIRAGWPEAAKEGLPLLDPMCGSGTFLIEAAMIATDTAPALVRTNFGFLRWKKHQADLWSELREDAARRSDAGLENCPKIVGYDISDESVDASRENVANAGFSDLIDVSVADVKHIKPFAPTGLIMTNPPYGVRLQDSEKQAHRDLGDTLIREFQGWKASVITAGKELGMELGMRAKKVTQVDNGPIKCVQLLFDIEERNIYRERKV